MATSTNKIVLIIILGILVIAGIVFAVTKNNTPAEENIPEQGKLDINVVCSSALAYMTFPDGASADLFIEECKEGKHPEVIERYKVDMGITDDRAI